MTDVSFLRSYISLTHFSPMFNLRYIEIYCVNLKITGLCIWPLIKYCSCTCSRVGKRLCTVRGTRACFPVETKLVALSNSTCRQANSVFHPSEVCKLVPDNSGAKSGSMMIRVAPIKHHWWYD